MDDDDRRFHRSLSLHRLPSFDYANQDHAYFVTLCAPQGTIPFLDDRLAREVVASLHWLRQHRGLQVYAYCLMPDHLHLLIRLGEPGRSLGHTLSSFKSFTTHQSWKLGHRGVLWQPRFYDHVVRRGEDAIRIAEYILANPVRKELVADSAEYPWSGTPDPM